MDRMKLSCLNIALVVNRLAEYVEHAAECFGADRNLDLMTGVDDLHASGQSARRAQSQTNMVCTINVSLHLDNQSAIGAGFQFVINSGQFFFENGY